MRTLELMISTTGEVEVTTRGYSGSSCKEASRFLEEALGKSVAEHVTAEFYQAAAAPVVSQQARS